MKGSMGVLALCAGVLCSAQAQSVYYVDAARGADTHEGSQAKPFASLFKAREVIRELKAKHAFPSKGVIVEVKGTFTCADKTLELAEQDSGASADAPVIYRASPEGALLVGGYVLAAEQFKPVTDPATLARLTEAARPHVRVLDLKALGMMLLSPLPDKFNGWSEMELFAEGKAMQLARWPNTGWTSFTNVIDRGVKPIDHATGEWEHGYKGGTFAYDGDQPSRWDVSKGIWMNGFWCHDWANETLKIGAIDKEKHHITSAGIHTYGIGTSSKWNPPRRRYYVFNLLEELDIPGEWYVDRENRLLYYYPIQGSLNNLVLSVQKNPIIKVSKAAFVQLKGMTFKFSTATPVQVEHAKSVVLEGLTVSQITQGGISVNGGTDCTVTGCEVSQVGTTGLSVSGGDRKTLTPCRHRVEQCELHHAGRLQRTGGTALRFNGVGITVTHNLIHDTPYIAVQYGGNDNLFEYNEVHSAMMESGDGGGLYTGRDWGSQGNIVRYNYFHHYGQAGVDRRRALGLPDEFEPLKDHVMVMGVYLDDCDSGELVCNNIFYKTGWAAFVGGGRYNTISNNLFIECTSALHLDDRGLKRARPGEGTKDGWDLLAKIQVYNYQQSPWKERYPQLVNVMDDEPKLPLHNAFMNNVAVNCPLFFQMHGTVKTTTLNRLDFHDNLAVGPINKRDIDSFPQEQDAMRKRVTLTTEALPCAQNPDQDHFKIQESDAFKQRAPWFARIPLEKIGKGK